MSLSISHHEFKEVILHRVCFELYTELQNWFAKDVFKDEFQAIKLHLNKYHFKYRKFFIQSKKDKFKSKEIGYLAKAYYQLSLLNSFTSKKPNEVQIGKFIKAGKLKEKETYEFVNELINKLDPIYALVPVRPVFKPLTESAGNFVDRINNHYLDIFYILLSLIKCLGYKSDMSSKVKDIPFIENYNNIDICNICSLFECWKMRPLGVIRFVNSKLK